MSSLIATLFNTFANVLGALRFARYVRKNQINTWIAHKQTCASACALVFLAGTQRFSEVNLIVHQYLPPAEQGNEKIARDVAWISVQRTSLWPSKTNCVAAETTISPKLK